MTYSLVMTTTSLPDTVLSAPLLGLHGGLCSTTSVVNMVASPICASLVLPRCSSLVRYLAVLVASVRRIALVHTRGGDTALSSYLS